MGKADASSAVHAPMRTCAVCREQAERDALIRWVRADDGSVFPDLLGKSFGRGAWVHGRRECLAKLSAGLQRSFKAPITTPVSEALERLRQAAEHRANQLLGSAVRQSAVLFGSDVTEKAWMEGRVHQLIVARDGKAALDRGFVREAVTQGAAQPWGTKEELGALFGRPEVAVIGVIDRGLAKSLFGAIAMALLVPEMGPKPATGGSRIELSSEVE